MKDAYGLSDVVAGLRRELKMALPLRISNSNWKLPQNKREVWVQKFRFGY
jgi:hypothetical protein